jgi:hypothetical protein
MPIFSPKFFWQNILKILRWHKFLDKSSYGAKLQSKHNFVVYDGFGYIRKHILILPTYKFGG